MFNFCSLSFIDVESEYTDFVYLQFALQKIACLSVNQARGFFLLRNIRKNDGTFKSVRAIYIVFDRSEFDREKSDCICSIREKSRYLI